MTYIELLRDPRWQRKRLEIFQRDGWTCQECGATDRTLNVHHRRYQRGKAPWEAEDQNLVTLCELCHERVTQLTREASARLGSLSLEALEQTVGALRGSGGAPSATFTTAPVRPAARAYLAHMRREIASIDFWREYQTPVDQMVRMTIETDNPLLDYLVDEALPDPATIDLAQWCQRLLQVALSIARVFIEKRREMLGVEPSEHDHPQGPA
jgi:HNH endonuclease